MEKGKMLRGLPHAENLPQLFGVREVVPDAHLNHVVVSRASFTPSQLCLLGHQFEHVADEHAIEAEAAKRLAAIEASNEWLKTMPVAEYSARRRAAAINLPIRSVLSMSVQFMEQNIRANDDAFVPLDEQIDYPADVDVAHSQSDYANSLREMVAGLKPEELKEHLGGRVSILLSAFQDDIKLPEVRAMLTSFGYNLAVAEDVLTAQAEEREALQQQRDVIASEYRPRALKAAAVERKRREDDAKALREKRAKQTKMLADIEKRKAASLTALLNDLSPGISEQQQRRANEKTLLLDETSSSSAFAADDSAWDPEEVTPEELAAFYARNRGGAPWDE
jgi:hypothetical protein